jgi:DNA-binding transcriptional LysR family regulator
MTPTHARAFLAVATKGSFSEAARSLNVAQPTVTNHVRQIEKTYGVELFYRSGRGASLTPVGQALLPLIRRMFDNFEEASTYLDDVKGRRRGTLRIGSYGPYDVIKVVARYRTRFPAVVLSVDFANSESLAEKLLNYDLDVAVLGRIRRQPQFHILPFGHPPLVVIAPRTDKWVRRHSISAKDIKDETIVCRERGSAVRAGHDRFFESTRISSDRLLQFGSRDGVISAVAEGVGIGTIFDEGLLPLDRVVKLKISGEPILSRVDVVCLADRRSNPLISSFFDIARQLLREAGKVEPPMSANVRPTLTSASREPTQTVGKPRRA